MRESLVLSWRLVQRNWLVYRKDFFANIIPAVTEPMFFLLAFGIGLGAYLSDVKGMSYALFMTPGLAMSAALFTSFFETSYNFYVRMTFEGIYHAILTTPIGAREIIQGEIIWVALKGAGMSLVVSLILKLFGYGSWGALFIIPFLGAVVALACGAIGLIATAKVKNINQFQTIYSLIIAPLFYFSGIFYPIDATPQVVQTIAWISPLYHGVQLAQGVVWQSIQLDSFLLHGAILIVMTVMLYGIAYKSVKPKLYI